MRVVTAGLAFLWVFVWGGVACAGTADPPDSGWLLFRMVVGLGGVALLAYVGLRLGVTRMRPQDGLVEVVERVPLGARRCVYLLRVGSKLVLVGSSDSGLQSLGEFDPAGRADEETGDEAESVDFATALSRVGGDARDLFHVKQEEGR